MTGVVIVPSKLHRSFAAKIAAQDDKLKYDRNV
jgi:hypothetical protein